jgi:hypothetical protein
VVLSSTPPFLRDEELLFNLLIISETCELVFLTSTFVIVPLFLLSFLDISVVFVVLLFIFDAELVRGGVLLLLPFGVVFELLIVGGGGVDVAACAGDARLVF